MNWGHLKMSKKDNNIQSNLNNFDNLQDLLEVIISLQGRQIFPNDILCEIVMKKKQNPTDYVKAYNLCDEEHSMSEIAEIINVKPGTLSPILTEWKEKGIIYEIKKKGGKFYKRLYRLELPKNYKQKEKTDAKQGTQNIPTEDSSSVGIEQTGANPDV